MLYTPCRRYCRQSRVCWGVLDVGTLPKRDFLGCTTVTVSPARPYVDGNKTEVRVSAVKRGIRGCVVLAETPSCAKCMRHPVLLRSFGLRPDPARRHRGVGVNYYTTSSPSHDHTCLMRSLLLKTTESERVLQASSSAPPPEPDVTKLVRRHQRPLIVGIAAEMRPPGHLPVDHILQCDHERPLLWRISALDNENKVPRPTKRFVRLKVHDMPQLASSQLPELVERVPSLKRVIIAQQGLLEHSSDTALPYGQVSECFVNEDLDRSNARKLVPQLVHEITPGVIIRPSVSRELGKV